MAMKAPELKTIIDSVAGGVIKGAEVAPTVAANVARTMTNYPLGIKREMEAVRTQMPDHPEIIPKAIIGTVSETVKAGVDLVAGVVNGISDTARGIEYEIKRVAP